MSRLRLDEHTKFLDLSALLARQPLPPEQDRSFRSLLAMVKAEQAERPIPFFMRANKCLQRSEGT